MADIKAINSIRTKFVVISSLILIILIIGNIILFRIFINQYREQKKVADIYFKSATLLDRFDYLNQRSISLLKSWAFTDQDSSYQKKDLLQILNRDYEQLKDSINWSVEQWDKEKQNKYYALLNTMDSLKTAELLITDKLSGFSDYNNSLNMYQIYYELSEDGIIVKQSNRVTKIIENLQKDIFNDVRNISNNVQKKYIFIKNYILYFSLILIGIFLLFLISSFALVVVLQNKIIPIINKLSKGIPVELPKIKRKDEFGQIRNDLYNLINYLISAAKFANKIGNNEFDYEFKPLSEKDTLGNSLIKLRDNMLKAKEEEALREEENRQRNWTSQGIALFNEVIRTKNEDLQQLSDAVIKELVNYTESMIGGLYIVNEVDEQVSIDLQSFYAFDRHKYVENKLKPGETLVGQCYLENSTIYINDVPDDYIYITSGLGHDKPRSILIVPLQFNQETFGIVELASFEDMPKYKIEFVERISETIASAISTAKINEMTAKLLEESKRKTELMQEQEKASRMNIKAIEKKLAILQEEYSVLKEEQDKLLKEKIKIQLDFEDLKEKYEQDIHIEKNKYSLLQSAIDKIFPFYEMTSNGNFLYANDLYCKILNTSKEEILNKKHSEFIAKDFINTGNYKKIWDKLKNNEIVDTSIQYTIDGKNKFVNEKLLPVVDANRNLIKIRVFVFN